MSVHTYIGARYVPRFMGTYDPTQIYEALDVVDNGSGTSYIARDTVPAGTPLTDTTHWFVYGAASGAIIQLQNDMIAAQGDIITLQGDMTTAQGDISSLQTGLAAIADIDKALNYDKWLFIYDSYGMEPTPAQSVSAFLPQLLHVNPANIETRYRSGAGFGNGLFESDCLDVSTWAATDQVHIVVVGGFNDGSYLLTHTGTELEAQFDSFYNAAKLKYPNSTIHVAFVAFETRAEAVNRGNRDALASALREYKLLPEHGMYYLKDCEYALRKVSLLDASGCHPTTAGGMSIAIAVANALMSGCGVTYDVNPKVTLTSSVGGAVDAATDCRMYMNEGVAGISMYLSMSGVSFGLTAVWQELATVLNPLFEGTEKLAFPCRFTYRAGGTIHVEYAELKYQDGKFYIRGTQSVSGIDILEIIGFNVTFPTDWTW